MQHWLNAWPMLDTLGHHWYNVGSMDVIYRWTWHCKLPDCLVGARYRPNAGLMLDQRRRRWPNIEPALGQFLLFSDWLAGTMQLATRWMRRWLSNHFSHAMSSKGSTVAKLPPVAPCRARCYFHLGFKATKCFSTAISGFKWRKKFIHL